MVFLKKIWQCIFVWKVKPSNAEELRQADSIIAFSFGDFEPSVRFTNSLSNLAIAKLVIQYANRYSIKRAFVQGEIASVLYEKLRHNQLNVILVADSPREDGSYPNTREVANWLVEHNMKPYGCHRPIVIAHPDHMWRAKMVCERFVDKMLIADTSNLVYDKLSVQWHTRDRIRLILWEIPTRMYFLLRRWI